MSVLTQAAQLGITHVKTIKFSDFTETVSGTEEVISCFTAPKDSIVGRVGYYLKTNFDGASSTDLTIEIGDSVDDNGYVAATIIHEDATEVSSAVNSGAYFNDGTTDNTVNGKVWDGAADTTITATFNPTGDSLTDFTAGEIVIFAQIIDLSEII